MLKTHFQNIKKKSTSSCFKSKFQDFIHWTFCHRGNTTFKKTFHIILCLSPRSSEIRWCPWFLVVFHSWTFFIISLVRSKVSNTNLLFTDNNTHTSMLVWTHIYLSIWMVNLSPFILTFICVYVGSLFLCSFITQINFLRKFRLLLTQNDERSN